jgi:hypothetical protein
LHDINGKPVRVFALEHITDARSTSLLDFADERH